MKKAAQIHTTAPSHLRNWMLKGCSFCRVTQAGTIQQKNIKRLEEGKHTDTKPEDLHMFHENTPGATGSLLQQQGIKKLRACTCDLYGAES